MKFWICKHEGLADSNLIKWVSYQKQTLVNDDTRDKVGMVKLRHTLTVDIVKVDPSLVRKISKRHFLRDIEKSFQEVTPIGPESHHFFILKYLNKHGC